ncbi:MAG: hypothetical protein Q9161_008934 [Pseudevernia consocians]
MEALGGAASVVGVVSLTLQVCEELKKIQDFWQSVKEAPDDIAHIIAEINLLTTWLTIIANNYQRHGFKHESPGEITATDTLKLCLARVHDMSDGVKDLERGLLRGSFPRRWASVKFVFRKDRLEKLTEQIERMKTLLIILQTCYIGLEPDSIEWPKDPALQAISNRQYFGIPTIPSADEDQVEETPSLQSTPKPPEELEPLIPAALPQAPRRPKHRTTQQKRVYESGLAVLRFVTTKQESVITDESGIERSIPAHRTRYDFRIARWLLSRGFSWQSLGMYGNWQQSFRTFRYISEDALIVDFCREGDIANVQKMFDKGLASPFDRVMYDYKTECRHDFNDEMGSVCEDWSLLHFSIANGHAQLCKFLIQCGLEHGSTSGMSRRPILSLVGSQIQDWKASNPTAHLDTLRIMIHEGQYDPMERSDVLSVMHSFAGSPTVYQWLLDQDEFLIDFEEIQSNSPTIAAGLFIQRHSSASKCLEAVISRCSNMEYRDEISFFGAKLSLAQAAVFAVKWVADTVDLPNRIKVLWDAGADFHSSRNSQLSATPLELLFFNSIIDFFSCRTGNNECGVERQSIPAPPIKTTWDVFEYDRLEATSNIKYRSRTSRSLWYTWYPGDELSILEVVQRCLDAWMEVLLEAGIDIVDYGRREDLLHPDGLLYCDFGEARVLFEYGDHVNGCRIHVTEVWVYRDYENESTSAETSTMPGSWDFNDA